MFSIEVDGVLMQEVILNLIENAVKYTPDKGRIEVRTRRSTTGDLRGAGFWTGHSPGRPRTPVRKVFPRQAQSTNIKGTGLGLYLVKYFIELHGGEVFLESEIGKAHRVGFTLPLEA